jgi:hypothetical protein
MAQNLDEKRKQLYNIIKKGNPDYERAKFDLNFSTQKTFESFVQLILKNKKEKPKTHWDLILVKDLAGFYRTFACDMPWAANLNFCGGTSANTLATNIVGDYVTDNKLIKNFKIRKLKDTADPDVDAFYISSSDIGKIPALVDFTVSKLIPTTDPNVFDISSLKLGQTLEKVITFNDKGFVLQYMSFIINATKVVGSGVDDDAPDEDDDETPNSVPNTTTNPDNKKPNIPIVKSKPLYFNKQKKVDVVTKPCGDFPFTLGCVNTKIGDLNAKLFGGDRLNDTYGKELENLLLNTGNFSNSNNELTQDTWSYIMNKSVIRESIKKVLKEYINKKK